MWSAQIGYNLTACSAATLAESPASPQQPGPMVTLTGSATCPGTAQYRFWIHKPDGTVGVVQDYSAAKTYSWNTTGLALGQYGLRVDARDVGAVADYETVATAYYNLADPPCATPTVAVSPVSPQGVGSMISFTTTTTNCPRPLYEFSMLPAGTSTWQLVQPYSSNATYNWNSTGALAGTEYFGVWVRDASSDGVNRSSMGRYDAVGSIPYSIVTASCASVSATAAPTSVVRGSGTHVTITGAASGCTSANPRYEFWMRAASQNAWQLVQGYTTSATYDWNSTGAAAGTIYFG